MSFILESRFEHAGLLCAVVIMDMGHRCGYVAVGEDHPLYGRQRNEYCEELLFEDIKNEPLGKRSPMSTLFMDPDAEFVRPDCYFDVHGGLTFSRASFMVGDEVYPASCDKPVWWFGFDAAHCDDTYNPKDLAYMENECQSLAEQLSKVQNNTNDSNNRKTQQNEVENVQ